MKTLSKIILLAVSLMVLGSCEENKLNSKTELSQQKIVPRSGQESPEIVLGEQKWMYRVIKPQTRAVINNTYYSDMAFDEQDNSYFLLGCKKLLSLDKRGNLRWRKSFYQVKQDRVVYYKNRLFILSRRTDNTDDFDILYCLNAEDGEEMWRHNLRYEYDDTNGAYAVGNNKVYAYSGNGSPVLVMYDLDGNIIYQQYKRRLRHSVNNNNENPALLVHGNKVVLSTHALKTDSVKYYHTCYQDNGNTLDSLWTIETDKPHKQQFTAGVGNTFHYLEKIEKDPYAYGMKKGDKILWKTIDFNGQVVREVDLFNSYFYEGGYNDTYRSYSNIYPYNTMLSSQNEEFYNYDNNKHFVKFDKNGSKIWEIDDVEYRSKIKNNGGHILAESGNVYLIRNDTLSCLNNRGICIWKADQKIPDSGSSKFLAGINHRGDLFLIDDARIFCYRGIGDKLDLEGWPRLFYDYGNTSFKN